MPRPHEEHEEYDDIRKLAIRKDSEANRRHDSNHALLNLADASALLDGMVKELHDFRVERQRIGEYDASADAIIRMADMIDRLTRYVHIMSKTLITLELDR